MEICMARFLFRWMTPLLKRAAFGATWQSEIIRYLAHGILHLEGYNDTETGPRRAMKREENRLVKELSRRFDLGKLDRAENASKCK